MSQKRNAKYYFLSKPSQEDFIQGCTSFCDRELLEEMVFKYNLSSQYPDSYIKPYGIVITSKIVNLFNRRVRLALVHSIKFPEELFMWTHPDNEEGYDWFEYMFNLTMDLVDGEHQGLNLDETLKSMNRRRNT